MLSSGVWAGAIPTDRAHCLSEVGPGGATLKSELERIGYLGSVPASHLSTPMAAHFELHIEQGPILEANNQKVGIVRGVQAYKWFTIDVQGRGMSLPFHLGTTIRGALLVLTRGTRHQAHTPVPPLTQPAATHSSLRPR